MMCQILKIPKCLPFLKFIYSEKAVVRRPQNFAKFPPIICPVKYLVEISQNFPAWRDFKINFSIPLFTIIFRPKMVFLDTDSILRVNTMYESVK